MIEFFPDYTFNGSLTYEGMDNNYNNHKGGFTITNNTVIPEYVPDDWYIPKPLYNDIEQLVFSLIDKTQRTMTTVEIAQLLSKMNIIIKD